jgi:hypothetical protein
MDWQEAEAALRELESTPPSPPYISVFMGGQDEAYKQGYMACAANARTLLLQLQRSIERDGGNQRDNHLGNLLARIHRDGGHYESEHGTDKAAEDADLIVANLYGQVDALAASIGSVKE